MVYLCLITIEQYNHCVCVYAKPFQSRLYLCNPMDCSPPASSVHGIVQGRILEWVAISFSKGSSWRIEPESLTSPVLAGGFFTTSVTWEPQPPCTCGLKKNSQPKSWELYFIRWLIFRTSNPWDSISSDPERTVHKRWGEEPNYIEGLQKKFR